MSSLVRMAVTKRPLALLAAARLGAVQARNCGWLRDWKPGPPPKTKEEREAAAKKYNLIPEDYDVYAETEGFGDYPNLPPVGVDARDPYDDFDWHYRRRNFGETLHPDYDAFSAERHDPNEKFRYSPAQMFLSFFGFFGSIALVYGISVYYDVRINQPMKPKQYPGPGKIHYTFEPAE